MSLGLASIYRSVSAETMVHELYARARTAWFTALVDRELRVHLRRWLWRPGPPYPGRHEPCRRKPRAVNAVSPVIAAIISDGIESGRFRRLDQPMQWRRECASRTANP